jgi:hypothetical protein
MSGVTGAERVRSRQDFNKFLISYKTLIEQFSGFVNITPSGSYNSNINKQNFGDIDLILQIDRVNNKTDIKKELVNFFARHPPSIIVPFQSSKHCGKRTYNSGEIVTIRYYDPRLEYSVQIDNIVALTLFEAIFKKKFLDIPAEKQGLLLGLTKIATIETDPETLFRKLDIQLSKKLELNQEFEFNLSSVELQLRVVTYEPNSYNQISKEVVWGSQRFEDVSSLLYQYDLEQDFDNLLLQIKNTIKNPRSKHRLVGMFEQMITVKSGEIGTAKGISKEISLSKINQTLLENA